MDYMTSTNINKMDYIQHINTMDELVYILFSMMLYHFSLGEYLIPDLKSLEKDT